jgi:glucans biosynthesis protein
MTRRAALASLAGLFPAFAVGGALPSLADKMPMFGDPVPFREDHVVGLARELAKKPFELGAVELPPELADLTYDQYRDIRFDIRNSIWKNAGVPFTFDLFHTGFLYKTPVDIHVVEGGEARRVKYRRELFTFGPSVNPPPPGAELPFAGFRLRHPINDPRVWDEFAVFLGASYFRAIARYQLYGISARALAVDTGAAKGEEFPVFRAFWIQKPEPGAASIVVHGLLDSQSVTGAYRFTLRPAEITQVDCQLVLFPRRDLDHVGFGPLTSMFLFDATARSRFDDFRPAVHDSNGLLMLNGRDEWLWRPLANPRTLQISAFVDQGPRGFGLMQRRRQFEHFNDLEAHYERRPSVWVEPVGDWGAGHVELLEIPADREIHDNIVAYWRPRDPLAAGSEHSLAYRLHWCDTWPIADLATTLATAQGQNGNRDGRQFVVDFAGGNLGEGVTAHVQANAGEINAVVLEPNPYMGGYRLSFELLPQDNQLVELRAVLMRGGRTVSETWLYRWTA